MKKITVLLFFSVFICATSYSQINVFNKIQNEAEKRANRAVDNAIDDGFDQIEEDIKNGGKDSEETNTNSNSENSNNNSNQQENTEEQANTTETETATHTPVVTWSNYDFVPGDKIIFEDAPSMSEDNGEFPSRWDLVKGQTEIANVDGENVIMFISGSPEIIPYLKNSSEDYLPEVFTIEFDFYRPANSNRFSLYLNDRKNQGSNGNQEIEISYNRISVDNSNVSVYHSNKGSEWSEKGHWMHISLAYTNGKLKVYMDDTRIINIPHYEGNPSGISLQAYWADISEDKAFYLKNIRIAEGGVKYYDRVMNDGKIVCNGIKFESGKANLKPESMGSINEIFELMQKQPDLKFSVEGHTDSDGADASNLTLSEARAKVVMEKLIEMGIDKDRLSYKGLGESVPVDNNSSPEGKANNRRVEFIKI